MRYCWADANDDPTWANLEKANVDGLFVPMFDPLYNKAFLANEVKGRGWAAGIYLGAGWLPIATATDRANLIAKVAAEYKRCLVPGLKVMFNLEEHNPDAIADVLVRWRALHPTVGTSWSQEPHQGGWMGGDMSKGAAQSQFVTRILKCKVRLVPQLFFGNMSAASESAVQWDLASRGFPASILSPFYDAASLPSNWSGWAFTAGRLPA